MIKLKQLKIGPYIYKVEYKDEVMLGDFECAGISNHDVDQRIEICTKYSEHRQRQALIHEIMHACLYTTGIGIRIIKEEFPTEEDVARDLATALHQVLIDNPKLLELFRKKVS